MAVFTRNFISVLVLFILSLTLCGTSPVCADQGEPRLLASGDVSGDISFNSLGEAVWSQWDPVAMRNQIFSSTRGQITFDSIDHSSPAINNMGDIVWVSQDRDAQQYSLRGSIGGKEVTLVYNSSLAIASTDINDRGEVVWTQNDASYSGIQIYSSLRGQLTSGPQMNAKPRINNQGEILYRQYDPFLSQFPAQMYRLPAGSPIPVAVTSDGYNHLPGGISDSGELVWGEQEEGVVDSGLIFSNRRGILAQVPSLVEVDLNNCGDVIYKTMTSSGSSLFQMGSASPCASHYGTHDTPEQAAEVVLGDVFTGVADSAASAPVSWYRFQTNAGDTIHVTVNYDNRAPNVLVIGLYDGAGNLISGPTSPTPLGIKISASYSGTYYLKVEGQGGRFGYSVSLSKYSENCGAGPCPDLVVSGYIDGRAAINALGEVFWSQFDPATQKSQIFSSQRGQLTFDQVDHFSPAANNLGDVIWTTYENAGGWQERSLLQGVVDGKQVTLAWPDRDRISASDINDRREVVWSQQDVSNYSEVIYSNLRGRLVVGGKPKLNNHGDVLFLASPPSGGPWQVYTLPAGSLNPVAVTSDSNNHNTVALSEQEMIWSENDAVTGKTRLVSSTRGTIVANFRGMDMDANACGDLVYSAPASDGTAVYRLGSGAPCVSYPGLFDSQASAAEVSFGEIFTGLTDSASAAVNWYRFQAGAGDTIHATVNYDNRAPNVLVIGLYDGAGNLISGPTSNTPPGITVPASYSGVYYLKVEGQGGRFGYSVSLSKYSENCGPGVCPDLVVSGGSPGSVNSLGEVVWSQWDASTGRSQVFSSLRGQLTFDDADHYSPVMNNLGDLVWIEWTPVMNIYYVRGYIDGQEVTFNGYPSPISRIDLNDHRELVWSRDQIIYSSLRGALTGSDKESSNPSINNSGDVVFIQRDRASGGPSQVFKISAGGPVLPEALTGDGNEHWAAAINDSGEVVWTESAPGGSRIVSSTRGLLLQSTGVMDIDLNNCGDVIYGAPGTEGVALYRLGKSAPCASYPGLHGAPADAAAVSFGAIFTGLSDSASAPVSWYRFEATSGDSIYLSVNYDNRAPNLLNIGLYDGAGNPVSGPTSTTPLGITVAAPYSGSYYLKVEGQGGRFGYSVSLSKYSENCGAAVCPDVVANGGLAGPAAINSLGEVVWIQSDPVMNVGQVFSSLRGQLTFDASDHFSPSINNLGDVVWISADPVTFRYAVRGYIGGSEKVVAETEPGYLGFSTTDINDHGEVVWVRNDVIYSNLRGKLTGSDKVSTSPRINNNGDVVFIQADWMNGIPGRVYKLAAGGAAPEAVTGEHTYPAFAAINDSGEVVWTESSFSGGRIVSSTRGVLVPSTPAMEVDLNNCGDVVYVAPGRDGMSVYRFGKSAPCLSYPGSNATVEDAATFKAGEVVTALADSTDAPVSWYRFEAAAGETVQIPVYYDKRFPHQLLVSVYDAGGTLLSGPLPAGTDFSAPADGTYYLKVEAQGGRFGYALSMKRSGGALLKLVVEGLPEAYFTKLSEVFIQNPAAPELRLFCREGDFAEDVTVNMCEKTVRLAGGYDAGFTGVAGRSRIKGALKVTCGKLVADGVVIR